MTLFDLVAMAIHNLWQRRMRTALNLIGIVIGCVVSFTALSVIVNTATSVGLSVALASVASMETVCPFNVSSSSIYTVAAWGAAGTTVRSLVASIVSSNDS